MAAPHQLCVVDCGLLHVLLGSRCIRDGYRLLLTDYIFEARLIAPRDYVSDANGPYF